MNRRTLLTGMAGLASAMALGACSASGTPGTPTPGTATPGTPTSGTPTQAADLGALTLGLTYIPDIQFAPFYVADKAGYFAQAGLKLTLRHHGQSESLFGALQADGEQVVVAGGDEMMQARSQGIDVVNFATLYRTYPVVLIVKQDSPIRQLSDLKGRSIGLPGPFGENWFWLLALLESAGLTQSDVRITHIGYTQQAALTGDRVDSVIGFVNNDVVRFEATGTPVRTFSLPGNKLIGVGLGATGRVITDRAPALRAVVGGVRQALADIVADPAAAVRVAQSYVPTLTTQQSRDQALATLTASLKLFGDPATAGSQDPAAWTQLATFMADARLLDKPVPAREAFTTAIAGP